MSNTEIECKECGQKFKTERSLHAHIKKHNLTVAEYYTKFYPRYNLFNGNPLPFKTKSEYFSKDFSNKSQMIQWLTKMQNTPKLSEYLKEKLANRIKEKSMSSAPCHIDLELSGLPPLDFYRKAFGSYSSACKAVDSQPLHPHAMVKGFFDHNELCNNMNIFIDTREQKPLSFNKSEKLKLDFGDYTTGGDFYSYTYVDRKSDSDFKSTLSVGLDRFKKELERAREFDSFVFVLVESSIDKIKKHNCFAPHKSNLSYIWHNTKTLARDYADVCQFLFSGGRKSSEFLIPRLLFYGKKLWTCDVQYYIDKKIEESKA